MNIPFFCVIISQQAVSPDPSKIQVLTDRSPPKIKEMQTFLNILYYLSKFLSEVCEPLHKMTSVKKTEHGTECTKIYIRREKQQSTEMDT